MSKISYPCKICYKTFKSVYGLSGHKLSHFPRTKLQLKNKGALITKQKFKNIRLNYYKNPFNCLQCKIILSYKQKNNKFCTKSCSAKFNNSRRKPRTFESKQKTSNALKGRTFKRTRIKTPLYMGPHTKLSGYRKCKCCKNMFWSVNNRVCCSPECARKNSTYRKIIHEYNHNEKIIFLESSWEVKMAEWLDNNNIEWIRPNHIPWIDSNGKQRRYFPDFYLPKHNIYLDPKNSYQIKIGQEKLATISQKITLKYGTVKQIIDWLGDPVTIRKF